MSQEKLFPLTLQIFIAGHMGFYPCVGPWISAEARKAWFEQVWLPQEPGLFAELLERGVGVIMVDPVWWAPDPADKLQKIEFLPPDPRKIIEALAATLLPSTE